METIIIGFPIISKLVRGQTVQLSNVALIPDDQLLSGEDTLQTNNSIKAKIAALVSKFDRSSIIDCNGDLVWLLKQLRQLSAI